MVLGTEDATPTIFWFSVSPGASVQLDDLVVVQTMKPNGQPVHFYGLVDNVRKRHEGVTFESDVEDVVAGVLPASVSYAARVLVTRVDPEDFIPPQPGDLVRHARGKALEMALSADKMEEAAFPAGLLADGQVLPLNFRFINGESGGHINISGISGVATKTSYALFLLHSIFRSGVMDKVAHKSGGRQAGSAGGKAIIFNVKGEDLMFLDKPNSKVLEREDKARITKGLSADRYSVLGLPMAPFRDVQFLAPPRAGAVGAAIVPHVDQRAEGVTPFVFTLREFCQRRMLPYVFSDAASSLNLGFVIGNVEEKLARLSAEGAGAALLVSDWDPLQSEEVPDDLQFDALGKVSLQTFGQLISYLEYKLIDQNDGEGDPRWVLKQSPGTLRAFIRRLRGVQKHLTPLVRGDLTPQQADKYRPNLLSGGFQMSVVDIHNLSGPAQMFVVGVLLRDLFEYKEKNGGRTRCLWFWTNSTSTPRATIPARSRTCSRHRRPWPQPRHHPDRRSADCQRSRAAHREQRRHPGGGPPGPGRGRAARIPLLAAELPRPRRHLAARHHAGLSAGHPQSGAHQLSVSGLGHTRRRGGRQRQTGAGGRRGVAELSPARRVKFDNFLTLSAYLGGGGHA